MSCKLTKSKSNSCTKSQKQGGLDDFAYVYNIEGVEYTETEDGLTVTGLTLPDGEFLQKVDTEKYAISFKHSFERPNVVNTLNPQSVTIASIVEDAEDLSWLINIQTAGKLGVIIKDLNGAYKVAGQRAGLRAESVDNYDSGTEQGADVATTVMLSGAEVSAPFKFFNTGTEIENKAYLEALRESAPAN